MAVESGAGTTADQADDSFAAAGTTVGDDGQVCSSDVVVKVNGPTAEEVGHLRSGATIISMMAPARSPELLEKLQAAEVTALAMDVVLRISRAQSMERVIDAGRLEMSRHVESLTPLLIGINMRNKTHLGVRITGLA